MSALRKISTTTAGAVLSQASHFDDKVCHDTPRLMRNLLFSVFMVSAVLSGFPKAADAASLVNTLTIPGEATDLFPTTTDSANTNRLGFFSDLYYDSFDNVYYSLADRGPGGGTISYNTRVQKFSLDVDPTTGAISNFNLLQTTAFTNNGNPYNGLNPTALNGNPGTLGLSFDPEGFAVGPTGHFFVSDEYGPSIYEFRKNGSFLRALATPDNLIPRDSSGNLNFVDDDEIIVTGRQDNRGFEGLTLSPDGTKLFAILQDPLVNEGDGSDGTTSRNLRIAEFDTSTGQSVAQYIYQLEDIADINNRIPGTGDDFESTQQGRSIGASSITALNDHEFLVIERDNRGLGVDDPTGTSPVGTKQVFRIDLTGATDVSGISLAGSSILPANVTPVGKSAFLDIASALGNAGQVVPEKFEGLAIGPQLADGSYAVIVGTDNDFSVTQDDDLGIQLDVCTDGRQVAIDSGGCSSTGATLIPTYVSSFKASSAELQGFVRPVPEPSSVLGTVAAGTFGAGYILKRRKRKQQSGTP